MARKYRVWGHEKRKQGNLTELQVRKIRFQLLPPREDGGEDWTVADVATAYGVSQETVRRIGRRETWAHVVADAVDLPMTEPAHVSEEAREGAKRAEEALMRMLESDKPKEGA